MLFKYLSTYMPNQATVFAENDEQYSNVSIVLSIGNKCSF